MHAPAQYLQKRGVVTADRACKMNQRKKKRGAGWLANVLIADGEMGHIHEMFSPFFLFLFVLVSSFKFRFKLKQGSK